MYTLRRLQGDIESNSSLGNSYRVVTKEQVNQSGESIFDKMLKEINLENALNFNNSLFNRVYKHVAKESDIYAFVVTEDENTWIPLVVDEGNYIMTESGATFSNISKRKSKE